MKFYYVAHEFNPEQPVKNVGGKRLAYYTKKHLAVIQCKQLNRNWQDKCKNRGQDGKVLPKLTYKVYCVESEPQEVTSD